MAARVIARGYGEGEGGIKKQIKGISMLPGLEIKSTMILLVSFWKILQHAGLHIVARGSAHIICTAF